MATLVKVSRGGIGSIGGERERRLAQVRPLFAYLERHRTPLMWLAEQMGLPQPFQIYRIKRGEARLPERFVERACRVLGVTPEDVGYYPLNAKRRKAS